MWSYSTFLIYAFLLSTAGSRISAAFEMKIAAQLPAVEHPDAEQNRAIALRVFEQIFNQQKTEAAAEIYSPDFVNHGLHSDASLAVDQSWARSEVKAFPDLRIEVVKTVAEKDLVTVLWVFRGTHSGSGYGGLPPTGTRVEFRGITIFRVADSRIQEEWTSFNQWSAYSQVARHLRWWIGAAVALFLVAWLFVGDLVFRGLRAVRGRAHQCT